MNTRKSKLDSSVLKFTLSLYENFLLPRSAVNAVIQSFDSFLSQFFIPYIQEQLKDELKNNVSEEMYFKMQFILEDNKNLFEKFKTEHMRFKLYEEESIYVEPELFKIGDESVYHYEENQVQVKSQIVYATHVPLGRNLKMFLESPGIFKEIMDYMQQLSADSTHINNFIQASLWLEKYLPKYNNKIVLPLYLYFDEFEVGNPLGSHSGEQKMGGAYVSLACLPPHMSGKVNNIFLSTICHAKYLKMFKNNNIFAKTINDLNLLSQEGISINKCTYKIYFQCVLVLGDNLGLNSICGFAESFTATRFCRICSATYKQCQNMTVENPSYVRTAASYDTDVLINDFSATGIKERCVFNQIENFHIAENIAVDMMHDLCEGIADYTIGNILDVLISQKVISLNVINARIEKFQYGDSEKSNKPRPLQLTAPNIGGRKLKMKQSAAEMLCLARYLGLMIGDLIPPKNEFWKLYLCLRKIIGIITSPVLNKGEILNLKELIEKHNYMYIQFFGTLKPKMHMWVHYVRTMLLSGPVINYATMVYERKNKQLKEMAIGTTSSLNVPYTIAVRHQLHLCYIKENGRSSNNLYLGPILNENAREELRSTISNLNVDTKVASLVHVEIHGKKYSSGTVIVIKITEEGPQFGLIKKIFHCQRSNEIYFQINDFDTLFFNDYYHAYEVESIDNNRSIFNINQLPKLPPCLYILQNNSKYVATRYNI